MQVPKLLLDGLSGRLTNEINIFMCKQKGLGDINFLEHALIGDTLMECFCFSKQGPPSRKHRDVGPGLIHYRLVQPFLIFCKSYSLFQSFFKFVTLFTVRVSKIDFFWYQAPIS